MEELKKKIEKLLLKVQRPSRYIGGEVGSVVKDKDKELSLIHISEPTRPY